MWGWQAVGSAESGCRGVVQWWGEGLVGERAAAYEAIEVSSRRFEIHVYDPERTELEVSGVEDEALPDLVGKFDAVEVQYPAGAWNAARSTSRPRKGRCVRLQGLLKVSRVLGGKKDLGANITKLFDGATDRKSPAASLKALYGYASNTPGARNGRYTDPMLEGQVGNLPGTSKQQLRIRSVLDVPADTSQRPLRPLRQLLPQRAWDGGESVVSETLGEPHHPMAG